MTVRNEDRILKQNIDLHAFVGVSHFFVYDDAVSAAEQCQVLQGRSNVTLRRSVVPAEVDLPAWLTEADRRDRFGDGSHVNHRQNLNWAHAAALAKQQGYEWLISLDADEIVFPRSHPQANCLAEALAGLSADCTQARFVTLEVVPATCHVKCCFSECTMFRDATSTMIYSLYDPYAMETWSTIGLYGHRVGKLAVRLGTGGLHTLHMTLLPPETHSNEHVFPPSKWVLVHYFSYDYEDWAKKNRNFVGLLESFLPISRQKHVWRRMFADPQLSEAVLQQYYAEWMCTPTETLHHLMLNDPTPHALCEFTAVRDTITMLQPQQSSNVKYRD
jgi:hypothetical protein